MLDEVLDRVYCGTAAPFSQPSLRKGVESQAVASPRGAGMFPRRSSGHTAEAAGREEASEVLYRDQAAALFGCGWKLH